MKGLSLVRVYDGGGEKGKPQHGPLIKKEKNSSAKKIAKLCMPYTHNHTHVRNTKTQKQYIVKQSKVMSTKLSYLPCISMSNNPDGLAETAVFIQKPRGKCR